MNTRCCTRSVSHARVDTAYDLFFAKLYVRGIGPPVGLSRQSHVRVFLKAHWRHLIGRLGPIWQRYGHHAEPGRADAAGREARAPAARKCAAAPGAGPAGRARVGGEQIVRLSRLAALLTASLIQACMSAPEPLLQGPSGKQGPVPDKGCCTVT